MNELAFSLVVRYPESTGPRANILYLVQSHYRTEIGYQASERVQSHQRESNEGNRSGTTGIDIALLRSSPTLFMDTRASEREAGGGRGRRNRQGYGNLL